MTHEDHHSALQKAIRSYDPKIHTSGKVDFDMGKVVAEGYKRGGNDYFQTSTVRASFNPKTGKLYSIFGVD